MTASISESPAPLGDDSHSAWKNGMGDFCVWRSNCDKCAGALAGTLQGLRSELMKKQRQCKLSNDTVLIYPLLLSVLSLSRDSSVERSN